MDQKPWLRGKRSPQKSIAGNREAEIFVKRNAKEKLPYEKQVASLIRERNVKTAQEANTGREKAEALKNFALKNFNELERSHKKLESKYTEAKKKLANLTVENARLSKSLIKKEEIIKNITNQMSETKQPKIRSRNADVANRQQQQQQQLETERQKLRLLVKKRVNRQCTKENEIRILKAEITRMKCDEHDKGNLGINLMRTTNEDQLENLKLINYDLDCQLSVAKIQIKEAFQKVSFLEIELEDTRHHHEELEAMCLELQLQLASVSVNDKATEDLEQERKLLEIGSEMTSALTDNKKMSQHYSLRDHMATEDGAHTEDLIRFPMITKEPSVPCRVKNVVPRALTIVPSKKCGKRIGLLRKLLFRRKRGGNKKKMIAFAAYKI